MLKQILVDIYDCVYDQADGGLESLSDVPLVGKFSGNLRFDFIDVNDNYIGLHIDTETQKLGVRFAGSVEELMDSRLRSQHAKTFDIRPNNMEVIVVEAASFIVQSIVHRQDLKRGASLDAGPSFY